MLLQYKILLLIPQKQKRSGEEVIRGFVSFHLPEYDAHLDLLEVCVKAPCPLLTLVLIHQHPFS